MILLLRGRPKAFPASGASKGVGKTIAISTRTLSLLFDLSHVEANVCASLVLTKLYSGLLKCADNRCFDRSDRDTLPQLEFF
jgi:hypothetical protein